MLSIYSLGIKLIDMLEIMHKAGYIHNDISLDKLHLTEGDSIKFKRKKGEYIQDYFENKTLHQYDFKYATPYIDFKTGKHLKQEKIKVDALNIRNENQSYNRFRSVRTSRKDDLEMVCTLLLQLSNYYELPDLKYP